MNGTAILCSGQGAQGAGMFELLADAPEAAPVFAAAASVLDGKDPRTLVQEAGDDALHGDRLGQILCCTQTLAAWAALRGSVARPLVVAGYSVGELAAWGVAGLFDARQVLGLAAARAAAMDAATTEASGLAAIRGLPRHALQPICDAHGAFIAIINGDDQMIVGGTRTAIAGVIADAKAHGAQHTSLLPVAVASHTPLLGLAGAAFRRRLRTTQPLGSMQSEVRLLSGIDGAPVFDLEAGLDKLARQIAQAVDWAACMEACRTSGVTRVLELGPGGALARMMQGTMPGGEVHSLSEFRSLEGVRHWLTT